MIGLYTFINRTIRTTGEVTGIISLIKKYSFSLYSASTNYLNFISLFNIYFYNFITKRKRTTDWPTIVERTMGSKSQEEALKFQEKW